MSYYIPTAEIVAINQMLCDRFDSLHEISHDKLDALTDISGSVGGSDLIDVAYHYYIAILNGEFFAYCNKATAFGALHALLCANAHTLKFDTEVPMDIFFPHTWNDKSAIKLYDLLQAMIAPAQGVQP